MLYLRRRHASVSRVSPNLGHNKSIIRFPHIFYYNLYISILHILILLYDYAHFVVAKTHNTSEIVWALKIFSEKLWYNFLQFLKCLYLEKQGLHLPLKTQIYFDSKFDISKTTHNRRDPKVQNVNRLTLDLKKTTIRQRTHTYACTYPSGALTLYVCVCEQHGHIYKGSGGAVANRASERETSVVFIKERRTVHIRSAAILRAVFFAFSILFFSPEERAHRDHRASGGDKISKTCFLLTFRLN